jgi:hypothetical protein
VAEPRIEEGENAVSAPLGVGIPVGLVEGVVEGALGR